MFKRFLFVAVLVSAFALPTFATDNYDSAPQITDSCGAVDPNTPCYAFTTGSTKCPDAVDYSTCVKRCDCQYEANKKKCDSSPYCMDVAASEHNVWLGGCITDWSG